MTYCLKDILNKYQLNAKKTLGQNFILDPSILDFLASTALSGVSNPTLLEIGPGPGGMTQALLKQGATVYAVEKDTRCVEALKELQQDFPSQLTVFEDDALSFDEKKLLQEQKLSEIALVSNLPYNISTVLLLKWLKQKQLFPKMTLMFQKEVAEKMTAEVSSADYGRLSVMAQWLSEMRICRILPPEAFHPAPKISSAVVEIFPRQDVSADAFDKVSKVTAIAFGQRRKMLKNSLKNMGVTPEQCENAGIDITKRPQDLSPAEYVCLAELSK